MIRIACLPDISVDERPGAYLECSRTLHYDRQVFLTRMTFLTYANRGDTHPTSGPQMVSYPVCILGRFHLFRRSSQINWSTFAEGGSIKEGLDLRGTVTTGSRGQDSLCMPSQSLA